MEERVNTMRRSIRNVILAASAGLLVSTAANADQYEDLVSILEQEGLTIGESADAAAASESAEPETDAASSATDTGADIALGTTRADVIAALGMPTSFSVDHSTLIYGTRGIVFIDDRVAGWVTVDPDLASRLAMNKHATSRKVASGPSAGKTVRPSASKSRRSESYRQISASARSAGYRAPIKRAQYRGYARPSYRSGSVAKYERSAWLNDFFPTQDSRRFQTLTGKDNRGYTVLSAPRKNAGRNRAGTSTNRAGR